MSNATTKRAARVLRKRGHADLANAVTKVLGSPARVRVSAKQVRLGSPNREPVVRGADGTKVLPVPKNSDKADIKAIDGYLGHLQNGMRDLKKIAKLRNDVTTLKLMKVVQTMREAYNDLVKVATRINKPRSGW